MQVLALPFVALFVLGVVIQVLTYRKEKAVKPRRIVISQSAAFLSMLFFSLVTLRPPGPISWVILLSVGLGCGIAYGSFVRVRAGATGVTMSYTLPWLIVWGALMTITQLSAVVFSAVPALIYGLAILNLGISIGMNARILIDYRSVATATTVLLVMVLAGTLALVPMMAEEAWAQESVFTSEHVALVSWNDRPEALAPLNSVGSRMVDANDDGYVLVAYLGSLPSGRAVVRVEYAMNNGSGTAFITTDVFVNEGEASAEFEESGYETAYGGGYYLLRGATITQSDNTGPMLSEAANAARMLVPEQVFGMFTAAPVTPPADGGTIDDGTTGGEVGDGTSGDGATSGDFGTDAGTSTTEGGQEPLNPIQTSIAIAISSILLTGGSILQLTDRFDPADILHVLKRLFGGDGAPPDAQVGQMPTPAYPAAPPGDPLAGLPRSEDGLVCLDNVWMSAAEAAQTVRMRRQGYRWDDRWGWVTDEQRAGYEAVNEASRLRNAQQDPDLALLTRQIQAGRAYDAARVEYWKQAQFDAQREYVLRNEIRSNQAVSDALAYDVSAAEWAYRAVAGVGLVADIAVSYTATALTFTPVGPLAHAIRAGYNSAKGVARAAGENYVGIVEVDPSSVEIDPETGQVIEEKLTYRTRRSFTADDLARGVGYGVENNLWDFGVDAAVRKVLGEPQLWKALASPPKPPASLLVPKATARQLLEGVEEAASKEGIEAAAAKVDPAKINRLFKEVGRKKLGQLEAFGEISKNEAAVINRVMDQQVDRAVNAAVSDAAKAWDPRATGVRLERVVLGDSGSSAGRQLGKTRSVLGDHDKTVGGIFNAKDVARKAAATGKTPAEVYAELNKQLTQDCSERVASNLPKNLTAADADVKLYSGIGESAGQADDYARGFTRLRSDVQGVGTSFDASGASHRISGRQVVDEIDLMGHRVGSPAPLGEAAFPVSEFPQVAGRQIESLSKTAVDPRTAAKAFDRLATMAERGSMTRAGVTVDPGLTRIAREILRSPQPEAGNVAKSTMALLQRHGYASQEQFAQALLGEGRRVAGDIQRIAPTLGR